MHIRPFILLALSACVVPYEAFDDGDTATPVDDTTDPSLGTPDGKSAEACDVVTEQFVAKVWEPALNARCVACHNAAGPAAASAFVLDASDPAANLNATWDLAQHIDDGLSVLVSKPSGQHRDGHGGGTQAPQGSDMYAALQWMADTALDANPCDPSSEPVAPESPDTTPDGSGDPDVSGPTCTMPTPGSACRTEPRTAEETVFTICTASTPVSSTAL